MSILGQMVGGLLLGMMLVSGCHKIEQVNGKLIYLDGGSRIKILALKSGDEDGSTLYEGRSVSVIESLIDMGEGLLFGECDYEGCSIRVYSFLTNGSSIERSGRYPAYLSSRDRLFFYEKESDGKAWLFMSALKSKRDVIRIAREAEDKTLPNGMRRMISAPPIPISENEILFVGEDADLWVYNADSGLSKSLHVGGCRPYVWMSVSNQILCKDTESWDSFLLNLATKKKEIISSLHEASGFIYVSSSDALVYVKRRSTWLIGETHDLYWYSISEKYEQLIRRNVYLSGGVWRDEI